MYIITVESELYYAGDGNFRVIEEDELKHAKVYATEEEVIKEYTELFSYCNSVGWEHYDNYYELTNKNGEFN